MAAKLPNTAKIYTKNMKKKNVCINAHAHAENTWNNNRENPCRPIQIFARRVRSACALEFNIKCAAWNLSNLSNVRKIGWRLAVASCSSANARARAHTHCRFGRICAEQSNGILIDHKFRLFAGRIALCTEHNDWLAVRLPRKRAIIFFHRFVDCGFSIIRFVRLIRIVCARWMAKRRIKQS